MRQMKKHVLLADLHGQFDHLEALLDHYRHDWAAVTILGDLGIGFPGYYDPPYRPPIPVHFIRGNHDNPDHLAQLPHSWTQANWHYIPDGTIAGTTLYIGGANSPDAPYRTPGLDWWPNDEPTDREWTEILDKVRSHPGPIKAVITHEAPMSLYPELGYDTSLASRTAHNLERLLRHVLKGDKRPRRWYFGHHHRSLEVDRAGTLFRCIGTVASLDRV